MARPRREITIGPRALRKLCPQLTKAQARERAILIGRAMHEQGIKDPTECAAFLAQALYECNRMQWMEELASGQQYEGRLDLGNIEPGDGRRYKGRGPFQLTGRNNYRTFGKLLGLPLLQKPEKAATHTHGWRVAALYWRRRAIGPYARAGNFREVTRRINGAATDGYPSHYLARKALYEEALEVKRYLVPRRRIIL